MKLKELIRDLGKILEEKKKLEEEEKVLKERVKKAVEAGKLKKGKYKGLEGYVMTIGERETAEYDIEIVKNMVGAKDFVKVVKIVATKLKDYLAPKQMEKAIKKINKSITISAKKEE